MQWDTAGQEEYRAVTNAYFRGSHGVLLVYDVTDERTLTSISDYWWAELEKNAPPGIAVLLCGNKADLKTNADMTLSSAQVALTLFFCAIEKAYSLISGIRLFS